VLRTSRLGPENVCSVNEKVYRRVRDRRELYDLSTTACDAIDAGGIDPYQLSACRYESDRSNDGGRQRNGCSAGKRLSPERAQIKRSRKLERR
jgi:hypothetical protein